MITSPERLNDIANTIKYINRAIDRLTPISRYSIERQAIEELQQTQLTLQTHLENR